MPPRLWLGDFRQTCGRPVPKWRKLWYNKNIMFTGSFACRKAVRMMEADPGKGDIL